MMKRAIAKRPILTIDLRQDKGKEDLKVRSVFWFYDGTQKNSRIDHASRMVLRINQGD